MSLIDAWGCEQMCSVPQQKTLIIRGPKIIAKIKICGGAITFIIDDTAQFEMPTKEQRKNLKQLVRNPISFS